MKPLAFVIILTVAAISADGKTNTADFVSATSESESKPKGPPKILSSEQRKALSRITSKGFITGQKNLPDGRKELTWTNGKDTVVTTQKVERVNGGKARDPRRAEIAAVKTERDALKAENAKLKAKKDPEAK